MKELSFPGFHLNGGTRRSLFSEVNGLTLKCQFTQMAVLFREPREPGFLSICLFLSPTLSWAMSDRLDLAQDLFLGAPLTS